ncbi:MAG: T9SS type A sorting domain-containing protein [Bacteroidota bacterium]
MKRISSLLLSLGLLSALFAQDPYTFVEQNGLLVIEAESAPKYGSWLADSAISGYTGAHYLRYSGADRFSTPGLSRLLYRLNITKTGTYRFQWRSRISIGSDNTEHNDSWLRMATEHSHFFAQKSGSTLYPHGSGMSPNPAGSGKEGWFKVYQNVLGDWTWNTSTSDHDPHNIFMEFDSVGVYVLEVSCRSNGHAIDRMVLYHEDVDPNLALDLDRPESPKSIVTSLSSELDEVQLKLHVSGEFLWINLPKQLKGQKLDLLITDLSGRLLLGQTSHLSTSERIRLPIQRLSQGLYVLTLKNQSVLLSQKFIK